ncbi:MAG: hypothetical protein MR924_05535 [Prevotella sp.]|nr:hypothetical protein [Prevotella sp.]
MSKKTVRFFGILFAVIAATGFVSCSDDTTSNFDPAGSIAEIFENMKGDYSGTYNTPYNVRKEVRFSIDKQAEFKISNFPMENVLYNIYKGEYENVRLNADALTFSAPIDSVGYDSGFLTFITKSNTIVNRIDFSYTKDEETHNGWALVTVKGIFNNTMKMMDANFIVTDLVIDNKDYTSTTCPIDNIVEAKHQ